MSIASEISRLQGAKAALKDAIETDYSSTIPSNETIDNYPDYMISPPTTFTLEQSSSQNIDVQNPKRMEQYVSKSGTFLLYVKQGSVYAAQLDKTDWSKFADGTEATAAIKDQTETMVYFPDCYYKASGKTIQFGGTTPIDGGKKFNSPKWIGVYIMSAGGHSRPNKPILHTTSPIQYWNLAQAIHPNFGLANYPFWCLICTLSIGTYKTLDLRSYFNFTNPRTDISISDSDLYNGIYTGKADTLADRDGLVRAAGAGYSQYNIVKMFRVEGLWGMVWLVYSGIRTYYSGGSRYFVVYDGNQLSNTATGRTFTSNIGTTNDQWIKNMVLGENWDMVPDAAGASSSTYYGGREYASSNGNLLACGRSAFYQSIDSFNLFNVGGMDTPFNTSGFTYMSSRLAFYGEPTIVTGAQLVALMS